MLNGKNIIIGVTGGIAAYKAAELTSRLKKRHANLFVIMTKSACEFITPLTMRSLSQNPVAVSMFDEPSNWDVKHISLADKADVFAIVPATANIIGKIAGGIADDMLTTTIMAAKCPKIIAPAMNTNMYENSIVGDNIRKLESLGYEFIEPRVSRLACGIVGKGALANLDIIEDAICRAAYQNKDLTDRKVLVTAGPTIEALDPVRFITNHSSGKMGYALAKMAAYRGAQVTLITGPTAISAPFGVKVIKVNSADDMFDAVMNQYKENDIIIKAAAVGDFKVAQKADDKIKKDDMLTLQLVKNKDILAELGKIKEDRVLVGFCMETKDLIDNAKRKLKRKNADIIVANNLKDKGAGFAHDTNTVTIIDKNGNIEKLPNMLKEEVADIILTRAIKAGGLE